MVSLAVPLVLGLAAILVVIALVARAKRAAGAKVTEEEVVVPGPSRTPTAASKPEASPWQQRVAAAARQAGKDPRSLWTYEEPAARGLVSGLLTEVASLLGSEAVIKERPEKTLLELQGAYAGAPFRVGVDVQLGSVRDVDMQCDNRLGALMVHHDASAVPHPADPNDPWEEEDAQRVFLESGVFIEGEPESLEKKRAAWWSMPAEPRNAILTEMKRLELRWVAATPAGNALGVPTGVALATRANIRKMDDPVSTLVSCVKLLGVLKDAVSQPASAPTPAGPAVPKALAPAPTPTAPARPMASPARIAATVASFHSLSSRPTGFWDYGNPAARELVSTLLTEVASLLGSDPVIRVKPDKRAVELHGTYAGAFFRFGVDVSLACLQDIQMKCANQIGELLVCRDMKDVPKPVDPNDPWDKADRPELRRVYLAKGVFVQGREGVEEQLAVWRSIPPEAQATILAEMGRLDLVYVSAGRTSVKLFGGTGDIREGNPIPTLVSYAELLELLKNVAQKEYVSSAPTASAPGPVERVTCKYCRSIFLLTLDKTSCPNCGANATA